MNNIEKAIDALTGLRISSDETRFDMARAIAIESLKKQVELKIIITDIKKDFDENDTYSANLVLELLESVVI